MAFAFDTLGYAKRLREAGVPQDQAEAARQFIMVELVTKEDLRSGLDAIRRDLEAKIENLSLRLTVRMGVMIAAAIAALAAIIKL